MENGALPPVADFTAYDVSYWVLVGLLLGLFATAIGLTIVWVSGCYSWRWGVAAALAWIGLAAMFFVTDLVLDARIELTATSDVTLACVRCRTAPIARQRGAIA